MRRWPAAILLLSNNEKMLHARTRSAAWATARRAWPTSPGVQRGRRTCCRTTRSSRSGSTWRPIRKAPGGQGSVQDRRATTVHLTVLFGHYLDVLGRTPFVCAGVYAGEGRLPADHPHAARPRRHGAGSAAARPAGRASPARARCWSRRASCTATAFTSTSPASGRTATSCSTRNRCKALENFDKRLRPLPGRRQAEQAADPGRPVPPLRRRPSAEGRLQDDAENRHPGLRLRLGTARPGSVRQVDGDGAARRRPARRHAGQAEAGRGEAQGLRHRRLSLPRERTPFKGDVNDLRFNFSPCFRRVGNQFVVCSTIELCRELVDLLQKEGTTPPRGERPDGIAAGCYASRAAAYLQDHRGSARHAGDPRPGGAAEGGARSRSKRSSTWSARSALSLEPRTFRRQEFRYDIRLQPEK